MQRSTGKLSGTVRTLLALALITILPVLTHAQSVSGDLIGTVADQQGAVIPNAKVSAANVETGVIATTMTNSAGSFRFPNLLVGRYDISVAASNFKTASLKAFSIELNK